MGHVFVLFLGLLLASARATVHAASFAEEQSVEGIRGLIGSRPPSCEGRCRSCGHCEAVQVPISPQEKKKKKLGHGSRAAVLRGSTAAGGRTMPDSYYDHSNYKPLSWRCKCGRHILEP
ncbi:hypothetical protein EJB05_05231 [Eragrostis curvula]|uniref:Epidermal patterning factor-like protein n=1 Tax=Eragrostis curvula TaxID=38414 RepID=A0A5J9WCK2_9POAL|nr:hypothetical protein EJB05_05231 [Eragrostis curvula]